MSNPSGAVIKGKVTTNTPIRADRHVLAAVIFSAGTTSVTIPNGTNRTLAAGRYGATQVSAGGTLSLSAGTYYMTSLTVASGATLALNETAGAVVIYVQNTFTFAGKEAETGGDGHVLVAIFGCGLDPLSAPFRGTVSAECLALADRSMTTNPTATSARPGRTAAKDPSTAAPVVDENGMTRCRTSKLDCESCSLKPGCCPNTPAP